MPPAIAVSRTSCGTSRRRNQQGAGGEEFHIAATEPAEPPAERAEQKNRSRSCECDGRTAVREAHRNADRYQAEWSEVGDRPHRDVVQRRNAEQDGRECQKPRLRDRNRRGRVSHADLAVVDQTGCAAKKAHQTGTSSCHSIAVASIQSWETKIAFSTRHFASMAFVSGTRRRNRVASPTVPDLHRRPALLLLRIARG